MALQTWRPKLMAWNSFRGLGRVDRERIKATFAKGVLEVHLPKAKEAKGTKIEVKAA